MREFDQLESRRRARSNTTGYPLDLQGISLRGAPPPFEIPPSLGNADRPMRVAGNVPIPVPRPDRMTRFDFYGGQPAFETVTEQDPRSEMPSSFQSMEQWQKSPEILRDAPGFDRNAIPPSQYREWLERPRMRAQGGPVAAGQPYMVGERGPEVMVPQQSGTVVPTQVAQLPPGWKLDEPAVPSSGLPSGWKLDKPVEEKPAGGEGKLSRFLGSVTPEGPISGLISLIRTAGQAAQGRRPDLLTNPEGAIPEAVQGGLPVTGARTIRGAARLAPYSAEQYPRSAPSEGPLQLTSRLSPEEGRAAALAQEQASARVKGAQYRASPEFKPYAPYEQPAIAMPGEGPVPMAALRPHINTIMGVARRNPGAITTLETALPRDVLTEAMTQPPKAAAIASWLKIYENVAKAKFTPMARASLDLATKNLNNNLGTDLTTMQILMRSKGGE